MEELREKVRIFEDGLDDRAIEAVKVPFWRKFLERGTDVRGEFLYGGLVEGENPALRLMLGEADPDPYDLPLDVYEEIAEGLRPVLDGLSQAPPQWLRVDSEYGFALYTSLP